MLLYISENLEKLKCITKRTIVLFLCIEIGISFLQVLKVFSISEVLIEHDASMLFLTKRMQQINFECSCYKDKKLV